MKGIKYLVLLRGINVGGSNIIKMDELKRLFEKMGFVNVVSYIQSGNMIFEDPEKEKLKLRDRIEKALSDRLSTRINIVILTSGEIKAIVGKKPEKFGEEHDQYKYNVLFLRAPLKSKDALKKIKVKEGVDDVFHGTNVVYFRYLISKRTQSYISKLNTSEIYPELTIRNWNTTEKLYRLMHE